MPAKRLLRLLILVQIPLMLAMGAASYLSMPSIPYEIRSLLVNRDALVPGATALAVASAIIFLIANICLYVLWRGGRVLYLVVTVVFQLMGLFLGPFVNTGWTDLFETTLTLLNGLILGLIYFSPAAELFERQAGKNSIESLPPLHSGSDAFSDVAPRVAEEKPAPPFSANAGDPAIPAAMLCPACGATGQGGRFCPQCGTPLAAAPSEVPAPTGFSRGPLIAGVVTGLVLTLVAGYGIVKNQREKAAEKAAEKARDEKSNADFENRSYDPLKLLRDHQEAARGNPETKTKQQKDAEKGADVFDRVFYDSHCDMGDAQACGKAAVMYSEGRGTAQDTAMSLALHRKACAGGYASSCEALKNVPESQIKAAADQLLHQAGTMSVFGVTGKSVADSQGDATKMFVRACDAGNPRACAEAAARYRDGKGVTRDDRESLELYRKACAGGDRTACQDMKEIPAAK